MIDDRHDERHLMVEHQLRRRGIHDERVLEAMRRVERHRFVPDAYQAEAYGDHALPVGPDQTLSQPYIVGLMTQALVLAGHERVLEVGTGTGYQTAILAELATMVYTIELSPTLSATAELRLRELGYHNVRLRTGDGRSGWPEEAPFDGVVVTAAPVTVPETLFAQVATGGCLVIPVGVGDHQQLERHRKPMDAAGSGSHRIEVLGSVRFVTLQ